MGYPMTYKRVVSRNGLMGGYDGMAEWTDGVGGPSWGYLVTPPLQRSPNEPHARYPTIAGDLRRLEADSRDERHLVYYAERTGLDPEQVKAVLDIFFESDY